MNHAARPEDADGVWHAFIHAWPITIPIASAMFAVSGWLARHLYGRMLTDFADLTEKTEDAAKRMDGLLLRMESLSAIVGTHEASLPAALAQYSTAHEVEAMVAPLLPRKEFDAAHSGMRETHARIEGDVNTLFRMTTDHEKRIAFIEGVHATDKK